MSENATARKPYIVVGGGVSGLLAAQLLHEQEVPVIGLEQASRLGGRSEVGHHRLYAEESVKFLSEQKPHLTWELIEDPAKERKKGEWKEVDAATYDPNEAFYLKSPFYFPKGGSFQSVVRSLVEGVGNLFYVSKSVTEILPTAKKVICEDGSEYDYEKIIWCGPLTTLNKVYRGDRSPLSKFLKNSEETRGGVNLEFELDKSILPSKNTTVFTFRYKDNYLNALGVAEPETDSKNNLQHWMLFLPQKLLENREEVAKCVRALKREIFKEFPEMKEAVRSEKIIFFSTLSGELHRETDALLLLPDVFCLGPEISVAGTHQTQLNLDRAVDNCRQFKEYLIKNGPSLSGHQVENPT